MTDWALDLGKVDVYHCITMQSEYLLTSCSIYHHETVYGGGNKTHYFRKRSLFSGHVSVYISNCSAVLKCAIRNTLRNVQYITRSLKFSLDCILSVEKIHKLQFFL
ncbi:hypothetical protein KIL84_000972 [Mauremys mutica]|uniref:Uncharacterized protein n=1 Tax=Mauremys mutica TaxID=74926 RepID=A0A9D3WXN5_9SAUR|nr:hypothetical protein KIL84_000972 [Mauremys mutica]